MINTILLTFSFLFPQAAPADSIRTETIDGKMYIIHRVEQKETLFSIARRYGVALIVVVENNPTAGSGLEVGALVKVPYTPNKTTKTKEGLVHRVGLKETLYSISRQYGVTIDELKLWNNLTGNSLNQGQELLVRNKIPDLNKTTAAKEFVDNKSGSTHIVAASETMYGISRKYGITLQQIKEWNQLPTTDLKPGQVIFISARTENNNTTNEVIAATTQTVTPIDIRTDAVEIKPVSNSISVPSFESVIGSDEVRETGMALLLEGTEGNRKYLAHHRSVKPGTILRVKNNATRKEVFVRVIGILPTSEANDVILKISKSALDKLGSDGKFPVEITYFK